MIRRSRAREVALQILYGLDTDPAPASGDALQAYDSHFAADGEEEDLSGEPMDRALTEALVRGVVERRPELDELLASVSKGWRVERMARVDRNILRIALYELRHRDDIPAAVSLNEAIELAKRFGTAEAPPFVNGVLDAALKALEKGK